MASKIIFNVTGKCNNVLLLKNNEITEFHKDSKRGDHVVGDIYLGNVVRVVPSLNAAFVNIGDERDAFLDYSDLSPNIKAILPFVDKAIKGKKVDINKLDLSVQTSKDGKIEDVLKVNQKVIVQISKEVIDSKGARISAHIALTGASIILTPFANWVKISNKIEKAQQVKLLEQLGSSIRPPNFGLLMRTAAAGQGIAKLDQELKRLLQRWEKMLKKLPNAEVGNKLIGYPRSVLVIMKELFDENCEQIIIDDKKTYEEIRTYLREMLPEREKAVHFYRGKRNIFDYLSIRHKLEALLGKIVGIKGGGYIIIEQTEALCVIDVNTGSYIAEKEGREEIALSVNLAAVEEIGRQLRLRDIGGIIVVDFIGMKSLKSRKKVHEAMKACLAQDPARSNALPLSKICLMEITRARVRPALFLKNREICPSCYGSGSVQPTSSVVEFLEEQLRLLLLKHKLRHITIRVHPYIYAYLHQGFLSKKWQWFLNYWQWIRIIQDSSLSVVEYQILNKNKEIVAVNPKLKQKEKTVEELD